MARMTSRFSLIAAGAAAFSLAATPAEARGWHHHHDGIGAGDVIAGALVIGGIAAIASAASKSKHDREDYDYPPPPPAPRYADGYDYRAPPPRYDDGYDRSAPARGYHSSGIDDAVDACVGGVERGDTRVASVDNASRTADGWHVSGQLSRGGGFNCSIDNDGRVRQVDFGDDRYSANDEQPHGGQWSDEDYARARVQADAGDPYDGDVAYAAN